MRNLELMRHSRRLPAMAKAQAGSFFASSVGWDLVPGEALAEGNAQRPKAYDKLAREITKTIRKTVELEESGASLSEIRKSGDPVKGYYRELLTKYDSDARVNGDESFISLKDTFQELGNFYRANGPNSRLTEDVRESVLSKLQSIDESLQ
ncbi:photosystem II lipoprotein Psb27 [Chloropicon primus]|nr:photosystem II lipoprotein Psb27 [Chloropicon primus]